MTKQSYRTSRSLCNYIIKVACEETAAEAAEKGVWAREQGDRIVAEMECNETHIDLTHAFANALDRCYETKNSQPGIEVIDAVIVEMKRLVKFRLGSLVDAGLSEEFAHIFVGHFKEALSMVINQTQSSP